MAAGKPTPRPSFALPTPREIRIAELWAQAAIAKAQVAAKRTLLQRRPPTRNAE